MSVRPPEVRVLKAQVATHRKGSAAYQPTDVQLKVAIVGPSTSGKTRLSNLLSSTPLLSSPALSSLLPYTPTAGVRILSFPANLSAVPLPPSASAPVDVSVGVELWDVSGSSEYENCWPAVCAGLDGVIVAFDQAKTQQLSDVGVWGEWFAREAGLKQGQLVAWAVGAGPVPSKPLKMTVKDSEGERVLSVPIAAVSLEVADEAQPPACKHDLEQWLGASVVAHNKGADFFGK